MISRKASLSLESANTVIISGAKLNALQRELAQRAPLFPSSRLRRGYGFEATSTGRASAPPFKQQRFAADKACIVTPSAMRRIEQQAARALPARPAVKQRFWHQQTTGAAPTPTAPASSGIASRIAALASQTLSADLAPGSIPGSGQVSSIGGPPRHAVGT